MLQMCTVAPFMNLMLLMSSLGLEKLWNKFRSFPLETAAASAVLAVRNLGERTRLESYSGVGRGKSCKSCTNVPLFFQLE